MTRVVGMGDTARTASVDDERAFAGNGIMDVVAGDVETASGAGATHGRRPPGTAPFLPPAWWDLPLTRRRQVAGLVAAVVLALPVALLAVGGGGGTAQSSAGGAGSGGEDAQAFVASLPPQRVRTWDQLAQCESSGDWSDDTGNGFYGGLQFTLESWEAVGGTGNPADAGRDEQIMRAQMLQEEQGWDAWPSCARQLGLV